MEERVVSLLARGLLTTFVHSLRGLSSSELLVFLPIYVLLLYGNGTVKVFFPPFSEMSNLNDLEIVYKRLS